MCMPLLKIASKQQWKDNTKIRMAMMIIHLRTWFSNSEYQKVVFCSAPKCVDNKKVENNYRSTFCDCFRAPK